MEKNSVLLSIQKSRTVRGYEVKRLPLGEYLKVTEAIRNMPECIARACFPDMSVEEMMGQLRSIDKNKLYGLFYRLLDVMPAEALKLLALLTGVEEEKLRSDPDIGLDGAAEMLEAAYEINGIENFMEAAERIAARIKPYRKNGFKS